MQRIIKNTDVVSAWRSDTHHGWCCNSRSTLCTDGERLWSCGLRIGYKNIHGDAIVLGYTGATGHFVSAATSRHVRLAMRVATFLQHPTTGVLRLLWDAKRITSGVYEPELFTSKRYTPAVLTKAAKDLKAAGVPGVVVRRIYTLSVDGPSGLPELALELVELGFPRRERVEILETAIALRTLAGKVEG